MGSSLTRIVLVLLCAAVLSGFVFAIQDIGLIHWGYSGVLRSTMWVGPDGTINIMAANKGDGSRLIIYGGADGDGPEIGADAELTLYAYSDQMPNDPEANFERVSLTQMNRNERNVRLSMERGGTGQFREFWLGYDTFKPGVGYFPLRITPQGVFVCDIQNRCNRIGG